MIDGYNENNAQYFFMLGEKLRLAREAQGLQVSDIAKQLFINKQRILELEKGDYTNIVSPLYLRWYLRSYAKIVGLPEQEIHDSVREFLNSNNNGQHINENSVYGDSQKNTEEIKVVTRKRSNWFYPLLFLSLLLVVILYIPNKERDSQYIQTFISHIFGLSNDSAQSGGNNVNE